MVDAGVDFTDEEFNEYFDSIDTDKDGKLSLDELINNFMKENTPPSSPAKVNGPGPGAHRIGAAKIDQLTQRLSQEIQ